jgi:hypothetical protein
MTQIVITMKVHVNSEAVPVYDIKLAVGVCHQLQVPGTFCLRGNSRQHSLNMMLDGHQTYNADNFPMHGDQQVKLNTLI